MPRKAYNLITTTTPLGVIEAIYIAADRGLAMQAVEGVAAVAGMGLEGDRYAVGKGSFSRWPGGGRAATLIAAEAVEAIEREHGIDLSHGRSRRNFVTRGVDLDALVGKRFRIGTAVFYGDRLCAPCRYLERLIAPGLYDAIETRGGLRTDIIEPGIINIGDRVELIVTRAASVPIL